MPKELLFCQIRKEWVTALPEEKVRQALITRMVSSLGYPKEMLAVEKSLHQLSRFEQSSLPLPKRRADLLCFEKGIRSEQDLSPLLLIECKALHMTNGAIQQVIGYNHYLQAPFIAIANQYEIQTGWYHAEEKKYRFSPTLPSYRQLLDFLSCHC